MDVEVLKINNVKAEEILTNLKEQVLAIQNTIVDRRKQELVSENEMLRREISKLAKGISNFMTKVSYTSEANSIQTSNEETLVKAEKPTVVKVEKPAEKPSKNEKKKAKNPKTENADAIPSDVRRLDFRIGKITSVMKHPDADTLYLEQIDVGESKPRTVVSGLVKHVEMSYMQDLFVVVLCNLKPAKMRGILSEAMVMCASTPEKVEILLPPEGCQPGDLVEFESYPRTPDAVLNPKKKIFESCAPFLQTNADLVATFKGVPFNVPEKGVVRTKSLANVSIK